MRCIFLCSVQWYNHDFDLKNVNTFSVYIFILLTKQKKNWKNRIYTPINSSLFIKKFENFLTHSFWDSNFSSSNAVSNRVMKVFFFFEEAQINQNSLLLPLSLKRLFAWFDHETLVLYYMHFLLHRIENSSKARHDLKFVEYLSSAMNSRGHIIK